MSVYQWALGKIWSIMFYRLGVPDSGDRFSGYISLSSFQHVTIASIYSYLSGCYLGLQVAYIQDHAWSCKSKFCNVKKITEKKETMHVVAIYIWYILYMLGLIYNLQTEFAEFPF